MRIAQIGLTVFISASLAACGQNSTSGTASQGKLEFCDYQTRLAGDDAHAESNDLLQFQKFIVKYKDLSGASQLQPSGKTKKTYLVEGVTIRTLTKDMDVLEFQNDDVKEQTLAELSDDPRVDFIEPDYPLVESDDDDIEQDASLLSQQWFHQALNSSSAWNYTTGSQQIVVAVVDSGIDYNHPDLKNNIWHNAGEIAGNGRDDDGNGYVDDVVGWNFADDNARPLTNSGSHHGTHVAGIIGANTAGGGVMGIAPQVRLMPLKFLGNGGVGNSSDAIRAIEYAIDKKVFAINNSWGSSSYSRAMENVIQKAEQAGILFVVSAGNNGNDNNQKKWYPASYALPNVVAVASTNSSSRLSKFSNYGSQTVHVAAPGENILSTITDGKYKTMSGTSMAAPVVTGVAVLAKAMNNKLNYREVKALLMQAGIANASVKGKVISERIINSLKAVVLAQALAEDYENRGCGPLL